MTTELLRKSLIDALITIHTQPEKTCIDFGNYTQHSNEDLLSILDPCHDPKICDIDMFLPNTPPYEYDPDDNFPEFEPSKLLYFPEVSNSSYTSETPQECPTSPFEKDEPREENVDDEYDQDVEDEEALTTDEDENPKIKEEPLSPKSSIRKRKTESVRKQAKQGGRRRRTRKNLLKPGSQLYQFILQLLDDKDKEQFIRWVRQSDGVFRIVKKEEVAKLWGEFKNRRMSYDSLSRGLRHYYQQGLLNSVSKKLHYQFTKKALDYWNQIRDKDSIEEL